MNPGNESQKNNWFEKFASIATKASGSNTAFILACLIIFVWIITGPLFHYSDTWQLVINTSTTIITFLMVFLIQKTQNKDAIAIQIKLNELVAANENASNRVVSAEDLSEDELIRLHHYYSNLGGQAQNGQNEKSIQSIGDTNSTQLVKNRIEKKIVTIKTARKKKDENNLKTFKKTGKQSG